MWWSRARFSEDGRIVAVASRPIFRSAREVGAFYRSALADQIAERGYAIDAGTGNDGRYFEIAGVPRGLLEAFSARSREVARATERFRARYGRAPERGELRRVKLENRKAKIPVTQCGPAAGVGSRRADALRLHRRAGRGAAGRGTRSSRPERALKDRVEERLTERAATFEPGELRAVLLEQSVGELSPQEAIARSRAMITERRVLPLEGGRMTTLAVRARSRQSSGASRSSARRPTGRWGRPPVRLRRNRSTTGSADSSTTSKHARWRSSLAQSAQQS